MYIVSQNEETIVDLCELGVEDDPNGTFNIEHRGPGGCRRNIIMANYPTLELAKAEIRRIYYMVAHGGNLTTMSKTPKEKCDA